MSDQHVARPDSDGSERTEALPPELQPLHNRLLADGERWRAGLPSSEAFAQRTMIRPRTHAAPSAPLAPNAQREWLHMTRGPLPMNPGRLRGFAGGAMAIAVVALFALLLRGLATTRGPSGTSTGNGPGVATITPKTPVSTVPTGTPWHKYNGLSYTSNAFGSDNLPAIAPSDPQTVYLATLNPTQLRRTTDSGATWTTPALPGDFSNAIAIQAFVSPLNAKTVFLAVTLPLPGTADPSQCPSMTSIAGRGGVLASGVIPCTHEYYSQDGGAHWHGLTLPTRSVIQDPTPPNSLPMNHVLRAQGPRLFAIAGCGLLCTNQANSLLVSDDGGASWQLADRDLFNAQQSVCDFAPSPTGGDVYVITATPTCAQQNLANVTLVHSADGGAHWSVVGGLPTPSAFGMVVVPQSGGQPLLYIHMPPTTVQGRGSNTTFAPTNLEVSEDGGRTWKHAPAAGIPDGDSPTPPIGVLADGTVLESFVGPGDGTNDPPSTIYGWKAGQSAWHQVGSGLDSWLISLVVATDGSGSQTLWATVVLNQAPGSGTGDLGVESYKL